MQITKNTLRRIILEEIEGALSEISKYHDSKGRFSSKGNAKTVSLSNNAKKYLKNKGEAPIRGTVTPSGAVSTKYGANTGRPAKQCGKLVFPAGTRKSPTRSCKDYPERYAQNEIIDAILLELDDDSRIDESGFKPECKDAVRAWLSQLRLANMNVKSASEGKPAKMESSSGKPAKRTQYQGSPIDNTRKTKSRRDGELRKKFKKAAGVYIPKGGFSPEERQLLSTSSLFEDDEKPGSPAGKG